ncbi:AAA family ATPase [Nonomuraea sp. NPDC049607]|uniref:AAA family ATPase n=1 Tax=Nonomuraea sp. NPDC049607 TaxID=3154732 RepID=UPI0034291C8B
MATDHEIWADRYEVIVLEGCDGVGKTTYATALATKYGYRIVHADRTPEGADLFQRHQAILTRPGRLVLDRSFISELVYGPLLHGRCRLAMSQTTELLGMVAARRGVLIHLTATPEQIQARLLARDGTAPTLDELRTLIARYFTVFADLARHTEVLTVDNEQAA